MVNIHAPHPRATLSVIIIVKNEAHDIAECILSVKDLAAEIIVFDSGSADGTPAICRELGAKVFETDWPGDGPQKNRALDVAAGDWVLCLDADERVGDLLRAEILAVLDKGSAHNAYRTPRRSSYCGRFMRHSGWWPDHIVRFFRRGSGRFTPVLTHTRLEFSGILGRFENPIIHLSIRTVEESLEKVNAYSSTGARTLANRGKTSSMPVAVARGLWMFFRTYFLKLGVLDGREGFMIATTNAEATFHKYAKLAFMTRGASDKNTETE